MGGEARRVGRACRTHVSLRGPAAPAISRTETQQQARFADTAVTDEQ